MSSRWSKIAGTVLLALAAASAQATVLPPPGAAEGALIAAGRGGVHDSFASFTVGRLPFAQPFSKLLTDPRLLDITHDVVGDLLQIRPFPIGPHRPDGPHNRVPEPATWATLLAGLAALAWMARRRPARAAIKR